MILHCPACGVVINITPKPNRVVLYDGFIDVVLNDERVDHRCERKP